MNSTWSKGWPVSCHTMPRKGGPQELSDCDMTHKTTVIRWWHDAEEISDGDMTHKSFRWWDAELGNPRHDSCIRVTVSVTRSQRDVHDTVLGILSVIPRILVAWFGLVSRGLVWYVDYVGLLIRRISRRSLRIRSPTSCRTAPTLRTGTQYPVSGTYR